MGVRTVDDSATAPKDYKSFDQVITFEADDKEKVVEIEVVDDEAWNPDLDFLVELYDPREEAEKERLSGDDT